MVSINDIDAEILELEKRDTSYTVVQRLAWLYIVRDHLSATTVQPEATVDTQGSEFLDAINGRSVARVMEIVDAHMEEVRVMFPAEYTLIINQIKQI